MCTFEEFDVVKNECGIRIGDACMIQICCMDVRRNRGINSVIMFS